MKPGIDTNASWIDLTAWRMGWAYRTLLRRVRRRLVYRPAAKGGR